MFLLDSDIIIDFLKNREEAILTLNKLVGQKILKTSILPIDLKIAKCFIDLKISLKSQQLQDFDLFIAATAISNNLTILTRNTKHFSRIKNLLIYE